MNAKHLLFFATFPLLTACGALDKSEKTACHTSSDCLEGSCVSGTCQIQQLSTENNSTTQSSPRDEVPGARDAILDSIARPCDADSECADGLTCIEGGCVCCEIVLENPNGSGYLCQDQVTPSKLDECVPRVGDPDADPLLALGTSCSSQLDCGGELTCAVDESCSGGTFRGCEGETTYESLCMCCIRIASDEDELFPGAFDCSPDPEFFRTHCS